MPRKIRSLMADFRQAGARIEQSGGKGSHRKIRHDAIPGCLILSGKDGDDAKRYQERDLRTFLEMIDKWNG
jgi:hypothetical protein